MIDPVNMTRYDLSSSQLEETILFSIFAANNNALKSAQYLETFLERLFLDNLDWLFRDNWSVLSPFESIRTWCEEREHPQDDLRFIMKRIGIGKHGVKSRGVYEIAHSGLDLKTCSPDDLEKITGIGSKTSRFFILHTRRDVQCAALDTHILKYMRDHGYDVPKNTPTGKKYKIIEQQFLDLANRSGKTVAEFDLDIWRNYSGRS